ncbi:diacylglycerol/lipid kinase family protein [Actinophytocola gossypii]|uniref:diacylglycerol/lipid kinase family protein n=1 Tax=Actinophytocola gossypii TaxID=2812003 RepID=UPI0021A8FC66|nr:diacylglycerol kinase family protein [Actinophytocola gossypii]
MRVLVIANPAAGGASRELVWRVVRACRRPVSVRWTTSPGEATSIARGCPADLVVSVGGDGTAREVAAGLATAWRPAPMMVVPGGTANSMYRSLWGRTPWPSALRQALSGLPPRRLDLARLDDRLVLAGASTGFSAQVIHAAKAAGTSYQEAIAALAPDYRPYPGRVVVDGVEVHSGSTLVVNVGGSRYRGGEFKLLPHSALDDGLLDVCVIGGEHGLPEMLARTRHGAHADLPGVRYTRGRTVVLERTDDRPLWFEHDGEVIQPAPGPRRLTVLPGAVEAIGAPVTALAA